MAKKTMKDIGFIMVRNVNLNLWKRFQALAKERGRTLGSYLSEALSEKIERDKDLPPPPSS